MSLKNPLKFLRRIEVIQGLLITLFFTLCFFMILIWIQLALYRELKSDITDKQRTQLLTFWALYRNSGIDILQDTIKNNTTGNSIIFLRHSSGPILTSYIPPEYKTLRKWLYNYPYPKQGEVVFSDKGTYYRFFTESLVLSEEMSLRVIESTHETDTIVSLLKDIYIKLIVFLIAISFLVGFIFATLTLSPVKRLNNHIKHYIEETSLPARLPTRGTGDQLDTLSIYINKFLERIEDLMDGMTQALDNAAHDLKTPLTRLKVKAESALLNENADKDELREALISCMEESSTILKMMMTIMDISEAEKGVLILEKRPLDVKKVLMEISDVYVYIAEEKEIELKVIPPIESIQFQADPVRVRQILGNLLDNAVKFSSPGSTVELKAERSFYGILFTIKDQGQGIPNQDFNRIWERLFRGESSRTTKGLGLGLSLVKALVKAHKGSILCRRNVPRGSIFEVRLPFKT